MTRGLYGWKPPSAASDHLKSIETREAMNAFAKDNARLLNESRDWLVAYHQRPRKTHFNWSGRFPVTITEENDHEESKASAAPQAAEISAEEGMGDAPGQSGAEANQPSKIDVNFTDTPF